MRIRSKLTIAFVAVVTVILLIFTISIYFFFANYRQNDFYRRLKSRAINTTNLVAEGAEEGARFLRKIEAGSPMNLPGQHILVYDKQFKEVYNSIPGDSFGINSLLLNDIAKQKELHYEHNQLEVIGLDLTNHKTEYIVVAAAHDVSGHDAISKLLDILVIAFAISVVFVMIAGWLYAARFLKPISKIIYEVESITEDNLDLRLDSGFSSDEIGKLSSTFNKMLERLSESFVAQKNFISNASHELRTPIAVISAEIEAALMQTDQNDSNYEVLNSVLENTKNLSVLSTQLLLLAQTSARIPELYFSLTRIDQILWDTKSDLERTNSSYKIDIDFDLTLIEDTLTIEADAALVKVVLLNLMDNACKYSEDSKVLITLGSTDENNLRIEFINKARSMDKEELERVFDPFFRGKNTKHIKGYGIGLPLARSIVKLHHGKIWLDVHTFDTIKFTAIFPTKHIKRNANALTRS